MHLTQASSPSRSDYIPNAFTPTPSHNNPDQLNMYTESSQVKWSKNNINAKKITPYKSSDTLTNGTSNTYKTKETTHQPTPYTPTPNDSNTDDEVTVTKVTKGKYK